MVKTYKLKAWIGNISWVKKPFNVVDNVGRQFGTLYETKKDAINAGWKKPVRIDLVIKVQS